MKYTDKLGLPIWNKPETDVFDIEQFNEGMQAVDDIVIHILNQINDLTIGDTNINLNGYIKEEVFKELKKKVENKADKEEIEEISSQLEHKENYSVIKKDFINVSNKTPNYIHIMAGMDSLTNGAGGSSWCNYFRDKAFAQLGCGGLGYIGLDNNTIGDFGSWGTTAPSVYNNKTYEQYSFDRKGIVMSNTHSLNLNFIDKDFDNCKIIYLKHPNGGSFDFKWVVSGAATYKCNTNSATYDLGVVELNGNSAGANGKIGINNITNGEVVIFGVLCTSNNGGLLFSKIGKGGEPFKNHANLNSEFREKWLDILKPDYFLFNGGTNDEKTVQANEYGQLVEKYIRSFLNKDIKVTLITPNNMINLTYLPSYAPVLQQYAQNNKCSYISHAEVLGSYESAYARGLQLDGCHPNNFGNELIASYWLNRFGLSGVVEGKQFNRIWPTSSAEKQYHANLTDKAVKILANTTETIYNLGFLNAYTGGIVKLLIHGQEGKNNIIKEIYLSFTNGNVGNQCTWVSDVTSKELYSRKDDNIKVMDFTVTAELLENKLAIKLTPGMVHSTLGNRDMYFTIKGEISSAYVGTIGDLVTEN